MPTLKTKKEPVKKSFSLDVFDPKGKVVGSVSLSKVIFAAKVNPTLVSQAVRVHLANKRRGTSSTKTRGQVQGSSRKIYKQKGTGRARHGSIRAPIFVHGGIVFGPKPRDYSLDLSKNMRKMALFSVLTSKVQEGQIKIVDGVEKLAPKTKEMVGMLENLTLNTEKKNILLVIPSSEFVSVVRAVRNIEGVRYMQASQMNTYEALDTTMILFMKEALGVLESTFVKGDK